MQKIKNILNNLILSFPKYSDELTTSILNEILMKNSEIYIKIKELTKKVEKNLSNFIDIKNIENQNSRINSLSRKL